MQKWHSCVFCNFLGWGFCWWCALCVLLLCFRDERSRFLHVPPPLCCTRTCLTRYGGNPIACAAALATLDVMEQENLMENATARGKQLVDGLERLRTKYEGKPVNVSDIRGRGLMIGIEFGATDGGSAHAGVAGKLSEACFNRGALFLCPFSHPSGVVVVLLLCSHVCVSTSHHRRYLMDARTRARTTHTHTHTHTHTP
jgi:acetylornithine/succinyldiaminopimelate/putrescine aminotransferase